jgi:Icc protein
MKFIHLTDTHLVTPGEILHGLNPAARLAPFFGSLHRDHPDAQCCIVTGDLADTGEDAAYEYLSELIQQSPIKFHLIPGNHDSRERFRNWFPDTPTDENGFVQYTVRTSAGVFIFLDTVKAGAHSGIYCDKRREWLSRTLEAHKHDPVFLFMHHPPFDIHMPCLDCIGLEDQQGFVDVISPYNNIRHLFFGHAHRPLSGHWNGISFSSLRGTSHQVALDFKGEEITYVDEPPEYSVVFVSDNQLVVHTHSYSLT